MKKIIKKVFKLLGFELSKSSKNTILFYDDLNHEIRYQFEKDANEAIKIIRKNTMLPYINLVTLYEQVVFCEKNGIDGDFVECGVWKGGAVGLMALSNLKHGLKRRNLHLFDAFEEICAPNEIVDGQVAINEIKQALGKNAPTHGELVPLKGIYDKFGGPGALLECKKIIENDIGYDKRFVFYHKGWFQNTIPIKSRHINNIAILRLDGDWYESTKICLENLFDKVVPNGFIIIDDYGLYSGCRKAVDDFLKKRNDSYFLHYSNWSCRYLVKKTEGQ
jgi:hypothetical protein